MKRRDLLGGLGALAATMTAALVAKRAHAEPRLRPPGALDGDAFAAACIRCFRCAEVCPVQAIHFESGSPRLAETPFLNARERGCVLCMACGSACPTGALRPIPFDRVVIQREAQMGVAFVTEKKCIAWQQSGVCRACYYVCPYQDEAITLRGPMQAPHVEPDKCCGCGLCEEACPEHASAIHVTPRSGR
ncbi:MAG: 4Fe-4S dicluster domain-containing protein [Deltaproteobacteria bacterium]|nr:4Fe-4S dicluster domain-containing protein [Deltaproteobacteria bacterium]